MVVLNNEQPVINPSASGPRDTRCVSVTSSLAPLITKHGVAFESEIVDEDFEESEITETVSESTITTVAALSPWDPILDDNHRTGTNFADAELDRIETALSPSSPNQQVTQGPSDTQSASPSEAFSGRVGCQSSLITDVWTTTSTDFSRGHWTHDSSFSDCHDNSLKPLLRGAQCPRTSQPAEYSVHQIRTSQSGVSPQRPGGSAASTITAMPTGSGAQAAPLASSTLFGRALRPSGNSTSQVATMTSDLKPLGGTQHRSVLRKSIEDMIKLIYEHRSSTMSDLQLPFHEPVKHNNIQSQRSHYQPANSRKSVQWQDREFERSRRDDMSDILDAYFEQDEEDGGQKSPVKVSRRPRLIARQLTAREHEKATARKIFRATPDWQDLDKISKFLKLTKG